MRLTIGLKSPLAHGAFGGTDLGNYTKFRRMRLVNLPGMPEVPVISGNAIRGVLRRAVMTDLYAKANMNYTTFCEAMGGESTKTKAPWDKLWAALYNGGTIDTPDNHINPGELRKIRSTLPPLSLFGSALYSIMLNGMCNIGFALPYCIETVSAKMLPETPSKFLTHANDLLIEVGLTRHIGRENADPEITKVKPMPYEVEALAPGTVLESQISFAPMATPLERSCLSYGINLLSHLGGKESVGFGKIDVLVEGADEDDTLYKEWLLSTDIFAALMEIALEL